MPVDREEENAYAGRQAAANNQFALQIFKQISWKTSWI